MKKAILLALVLGLLPGVSNAGWFSDTLRSWGISWNRDMGKEYHAFKRETGMKYGEASLNSFAAKKAGKGKTTSVPELDPSAAGAALILLAGSAAVLISRRRRLEG